jgi:hypothetical protein
VGSAASLIARLGAQVALEPPVDTDRERLARLARLWKIELDYQQLNRELGLEHYEGRSWLWCCHRMLDRPQPNLPTPQSISTASDGGFPGVEMSCAQLLSCSHHARFWCGLSRAKSHTDET